MNDTQPVVALKRLQQLPEDMSFEGSMSSKRTNQSTAEYENDENPGPNPKKPKLTSLCDTDSSDDGNLPFVCRLCEDGKFTLRKDLVDHTLLHTDTETGTCLTCKKSFKEHHRLREHMFRKHSVDKNHTCTICKEEFPRLKALDFHMRCHKKQTKGLVCKLCGIKFQTKASLKLHLSRHGCYINQAALGSTHKSTAHMKTHNKGKVSTKTVKDKHSLGTDTILSEKPKQTSVCDTDNSEPGNLQFVCRLCEDGKSASRKDLIDHTLLHTDTKTSTCLACKKSFDKHDRLREHMFRMHTVDKNLTCTVCKKEFPRSMERNIHMRCHNKQTKGFDCELCGNTFKRKVSLRLHLAEHKCNVRQAATGSKNKLTAHIQGHSQGKYPRKTFTDKDSLGTNIPPLQKRKPTSLGATDSSECGNPPFVCCLCEDGKFALRKDLIDHVMLHADTQTGTCVTCKKSFDKHYRLREHMFRNHTVDKNLTCKVCKKEFSRSVVRDYHMRCHNKQTKGFDCELCGRKFKTKVSLQLHLAKHKCNIRQTTIGSKHKTPHMKKHNQGKLSRKTFKDKRRQGTHTILSEKPKPTSLCDTNSSEDGNLPFVCLLCDDRKFALRKDLIDHTLIHTDNKTRTCLACKKSYDKHFRLREHMFIKHTVDKNLTCPVCEREFPRLIARTVHLRIHNKDRPEFHCELCGSKFKRKVSLRLHQEEHKCNLAQTTTGSKHKLTSNMKTREEGKISSKTFKDTESSEGGNLPFVCQICEDGKFTFRKDLIDHTLLHTDTKTGTCLTCKKSFDKHHRLREHMFRQHTVDKNLTCIVCKKEFSRLIARNIHIRCHNKQKTGFGCELCGRKFKTKVSMLLHLERQKCNVHQTTIGSKDKFTAHKKTHEERNNSSGVCGKKLGYQSAVKFPFSKHSNKKPLKCDKCNMAFTGPCGLNAHIRSVHKLIKDYTCIICNKAFACSNYLTGHMITHTKEKPFPCSVCGKRFGFKSQVKAHMRTHSGVKPYFCVLCDRRFKSYPILKKHIASHSEERPYWCVLCDKRFKHTSHLHCHLLTHTGEKPHSCTVCGRSFAQSGHVKTHLAKVHKVGETAECDQMSDS